MKPSLDILDRAGRERTEAFVAARMGALFEKLPPVCGFSVSQDLAVVDLVWHAWPGYTPSAQLYLDVAEAIGELLDERPSAAELLRGRTFARTLH